MFGRQSPYYSIQVGYKRVQNPGLLWYRQLKVQICHQMRWGRLGGSTWVRCEKIQSSHQMRECELRAQKRSLCCPYQLRMCQTIEIKQSPKELEESCRGLKPLVVMLREMGSNSEVTMRCSGFEGGAVLTQLQIQESDLNTCAYLLQKHLSGS